MREVCIVATGVANLASVKACLSRLGVSYRQSKDSSFIEDASHVVLPGVGSMGAAGASMKQDGIDNAILQRLRSNRPTLGICLGMQLMGRGSQESPDVAGLRFLDCDAVSFPSTMIVPHMGWNRVQSQPHHRVLASGYAYFAHSYYWGVREHDPDWALADYGGLCFAAGFERGNIVACQFHPELSGDYGREIVERFLRIEERC